MEPSLPSPDLFASMAVAVLFVIVLWDAFWLTRQRLDVPTLGELPNGGFAWESEGAQELIRQWGNLGSMAAMMVLPWGLASQCAILQPYQNVCLLYTSPSPRD